MLLLSLVCLLIAIIKAECPCMACNECQGGLLVKSGALVMTCYELKEATELPQDLVLQRNQTALLTKPLNRSIQDRKCWRKLNSMACAGGFSVIRLRGQYKCAKVSDVGSLNSESWQLKLIETTA